MLLPVEQRDDERESAKDAAFAQQLEDEFDNLDEEFLREYRLKRLEELRKAYEAEYDRFFVLVHISSDGVATHLDNPEKSEFDIAEGKLGKVGEKSEKLWFAHGVLPQLW